MFRFTIRDVLWLMVVVGLLLAWGMWWESLPSRGKGIQGTVSVAGKPLEAGRIVFYSADGQFRGAEVTDGQFHVEGLPIGGYRVVIEGETVATLYSDLQRAGITHISKKTKSLQFGLHSREHLSQIGFDSRDVAGP